MWSIYLASEVGNSKTRMERPDFSMSPCSRLKMAGSLCITSQFSQSCLVPATTPYPEETGSMKLWPRVQDHVVQVHPGAEEVLKGGPCAGGKYLKGVLRMLHGQTIAGHTAILRILRTLRLKTTTQQLLKLTQIWDDLSSPTWSSPHLPVPTFPPTPTSARD
ncbi:uncharacterized protein WM277_026310 [Molossus nigricans]